MQFLLVSLLIFGILNVIGGFIQDTNNFGSAMVYKVIPFFGGVISILISLQELNIINIL